jgi:hypothetical protein
LENCAGWRAQSIMTEKVLEGKEDFCGSLQTPAGLDSAVN